MCVHEADELERSTERKGKNAYSLKSIAVTLSKFAAVNLQRIKNEKNR